MLLLMNKVGQWRRLGMGEPSDELLIEKLWSCGRR
jgi:hypothetical protein